MIVVDTNVIAYLFLPGQFTPAAEALLLQEEQWVAPPLWRSEMRNILAGYLRRETLSYEEACAIMHAAERLLTPFERDIDSVSVMNLVRQSDCSAYDCEFVALAQMLGVDLITMDKKVLASFPLIAKRIPDLDA